jgi:hypothetical protein
MYITRKRKKERNRTYANRTLPSKLYASYAHARTFHPTKASKMDDPPKKIQTSNFSQVSTTHPLLSFLFRKKKRNQERFTPSTLKKGRGGLTHPHSAVVIAAFSAAFRDFAVIGNQLAGLDGLFASWRTLFGR